MYNVRYKGVEIRKSQPKEYVDTIVSPILSTSGSFDLLNIDKSVSKLYNDYSTNNISKNCIDYANELGYNVKSKRIAHWNKVVYKFSNLKYGLTENTELYSESFFYEFSNPLSDCEFIYIESEYLDFNIVIWYTDGDTRSIPLVPGNHEYVVKSKDMINQFKEISSYLFPFGFKCTYDLNRLIIKWIQGVEGATYKITVGKFVKDIQYAGIRFFNRDTLLSNTNAIVSNVDNSRIILSNLVESVQINNSDTSKYLPAVSIGDRVEIGTPLYVNFNYSYPNYNKVYKDIDSYDNLKTDELLTTNKTYSVKINLDWYNNNPGKAINKDQNAYILLNNGIYNVLIWYSSGESVDLDGIVIGYEGKSVKLGKVFTFDNSNLSKSYAIRAVSRKKFILTEKYGMDDNKWITIATTDKYLDTEYTYEYVNEPKDNYEQIHTLSFKWEEFGKINYLVLENNSGDFVVTESKVFESSEDNVGIEDIRFPVDSIFSPLKYSYHIASKDSYVFQGLIGDYIDGEVNIFGSECPVVKTLDINPNYWKIEEFYDEEDTSVNKRTEEEVRYEQIKILIDYLQLIGFIVEYDELDLLNLKEITLYSYDSLRILDISPVFSVVDNINGSYDMICSIDDEYKILDIRSKFPTHSPEIELEFKLNSRAEYTLYVTRYDKNNSIVDNETFVVSLDPSDQVHFIDSVLENSNIIQSTTYAHGRIIPGKYRLLREEPYNVNTDDIMVNLINMRLESEPCEIFMDSGILRYSHQLYVSNLYTTSGLYRLCLFNIMEPEKFDISYLSDCLNTSFSYPNLYMNNKIYPNYIMFLKKSIEENDYSGELNIDYLEVLPNELETSNLMSVYFDNYRYVLTHNYIYAIYDNTSEPVVIHAEIALIMARIVNNVYKNINFQLGESSIRTQYAMLMNTILRDSRASLYNYRLDKLELKDRTCNMYITLIFNLYKSDPINIRLILNVDRKF